MSEALDSCSIYRNEMSEERSIVCLCTAIIVYLGFYDFEKGHARFQTPAHMLALLQQTVKFSEFQDLAQMM